MTRFFAWLAELNTAAARLGFGDGLTETTGADCWRPYFDDGLTPSDALAADAALDGDL